MADFPTLEWFREFTDHLEDDDTFQESAAHFDGAILLEIGEQVIWMKIYRGQILEVLNQEAEFGSTFTLSGPAEEWERLLTQERNPFGEQQTRGLITTTGNVLEATRMIDAINAMVNCLRAETGETVAVAGGADR